jgi:hypothetical protein
MASRFVSSLVLAALLALVPAAAAAQHCWPAAVTLLLRDRAGAPIDPREVEVAYHPQPSDTADFRVVVEPLDAAVAERLSVPGAVALHWQGRGHCRIDIDSVVVRRGGRSMRLLPGIHLNSLQAPGPSVFLVEAPPFSADTYLLDPLPPGSLPPPTLVPATAWRRLGDGEAPDRAPSPHPCTGGGRSRG